MENKNYFSMWESQFSANRAYLVSFAFRMTGSLSEAEDLVQDTFIECAKINPAEIKNHKSWLTKVCSNKGLDHLKSAYKRRETYPGVWLPDAVPDSFQIWDSLNTVDSPDASLLLSESLTTSFLVLIEKLTPEERVVYILKEVFDYSFQEISNFLNKSEEACRKIAQRARKAIESTHQKFNSNSLNAEKLIAVFFDHVKKGDKLALIDLLSDESEFWSDGGGKVSAAPPMIREKEKIAQFFSSQIISRLFASPEYKAEFSRVNNRSGLVISKNLPSGEWIFETIFTFEIMDNKIVRIYVQRNPDKLKALDF